MTNDLFSRICRLGDHHNKRASSWDRSGGNKDCVTLEPGQTIRLLDEQGAGCIRHFYWTYIENKEQPRLDLFRSWVLRIYWDHSDLPSVEVPFGDFFGVSNGIARPLSSLAFTNSCGLAFNGHHSWGFNCYLPMPFSKAARIEIENQGTTGTRFWYHIDYETYDDPRHIDNDTGRLHACWHREKPTTAIPNPHAWTENETKNLDDSENYVLLDTAGDGQYIGHFMTVVNHERGWWGEGDDMIFIDGESFPPSLHGTGTEEIYGGGASPMAEYSHPFTGFHCIENRLDFAWWGVNGMYRFHLTDPIRFRKSIRVTIEHGHGNDKANDYSSTAFWYQREINPSPLPLPPPEKRAITLS